MTRAPASDELRGRVRVARGPRAAEALLFSEVEALVAEGLRDPALLSRPIRVVVPSRSLREHVSAALVRRAGRSLVGLSVQTLQALAREVIERAGERRVSGERLFPVLVRQEARREPVLGDALESLRDGYGVVCATIADLLDAGLRAESAPAVLEALGQGSLEAERARASVRVALAVAQRMAHSDIGRDGESFRRARRLLDRDPDSALPARAILIHGFADATGAAAELLDALARRRGASIFLDHPPDPVDAEKPDAGVAFAERFRERMGWPLAPVVAQAGPGATLALLEAPGTDAEVRAVAERAARLVADGTAPESIGIVARALEPYALAIRAHFRALGLPFSGLASRGPRRPEGRRALALLDLVERRAEAPSDVWLEALSDGVFSPGVLLDVRIGLHALGAARVSDVARLRIEEALDGRAWLPLPVRRGLEAEESGDDEPPRTEVRATSRTLSARALGAAVEQAQSLCRDLEGWRHEATLAEHTARLRALAADTLGWDAGAIDAALAPLGDRLPELELSERDFALLLREPLREVGLEALGGAGAGVQVLDVTEARARTFDHLFVLGLNREVFPRLISEDPVLPDDLRRAARGALIPHPHKGHRWAAERYLFAQHCTASPAITLCWQSADDDGRARPASPFVERLKLARELPTVSRAPSLRAAPRDVEGTRTPRPAREHAILAGLYGERASLEPILACAFEEAFPDQDARALAQLRVAMLDELDPDLRTREGCARAQELGPYFGFVGPVRERADPRRRDLHVTTLESVARCPWQTYLRRMLRLEPAPDALGELPALDALLVGQSVHLALELVARRALDQRPQTFSGVLALPPVFIPWPEHEELEEILLEASRKTLNARGVALPGFAGALAARARPYLKAAREVEWREPPAVLGVEVSTSFEVGSPQAPRALHLRADRVDRAGEGVRLTDYKTGKPVSIAKRKDTRLKHFLSRVREGTHLQAVAYARAAPPPCEGRYVFLKPDLAEPAREARVLASDKGLRRAFDEAVAASLAIWDRGSFFPRLVKSNLRDTADACRWCELAEACLQHDSGARARLRRFAQPGATRARSAEEQAVLDLLAPSDADGDDA